MYVIQIADVIDILSLYSCNENVIAIDMLSYFQEYNKVCILIKATCNGNKKYVIKLLNIEPIEIFEEEERNVFSEFLRLKGLSVPKKHINSNHYCATITINDIDFLATVEDYFGEDVKEITLQSVFELGSILGNLHQLSYSHGYHLKQGCVLSSLKSGRTRFDSIWSELDAIVFDNPEEIQKIRILHNNKIEELKKLWNELPTTAVHGDLGLTSNFMYQSSGYGIIDFNLAGDEVLLGDLLITWYSSRYSNDFIRKVPFNNVSKIKQSFFQGYYSKRELTDIEHKNFDKVSIIINGIYFNRFVAELAKEGNVQLAKKLSKYIFEHYYTDDTSINLAGELKL